MQPNPPVTRIRSDVDSVTDNTSFSFATNESAFGVAGADLLILLMKCLIQRTCLMPSWFTSSFNAEPEATGFCVTHSFIYSS